MRRTFIFPCSASDFLASFRHQVYVEFASGNVIDVAWQQKMNGKIHQNPTYGIQGKSFLHRECSNARHLQTRSQGTFRVESGFILTQCSGHAAILLTLPGPPRSDALFWWQMMATSHHSSALESTYVILCVKLILKWQIKSKDPSSQSSVFTGTSPSQLQKMAVIKLQHLIPSEFNHHRVRKKGGRMKVRHRLEVSNSWAVSPTEDAQIRPILP